jgi:hypothetical protein
VVRLLKQRGRSGGTMGKGREGGSGRREARGVRGGGGLAGAPT